jgi:WD40 repeat protein
LIAGVGLVEAPRRDGLSLAYLAAQGKPDQPHCFNAGKDGFWCLAVSPDGKQALMGGGDDGGNKDYAVRLWDLGKGKEVGRLEGHTKGVIHVDFLARGTQALTVSYDLTVRVWALPGGKELRRSKLPGNDIFAFQHGAVSPDGRLLVLGNSGYGSNRDFALSVWNVEKLVQLHTLVGHTAGVSYVAFSQDGTRLISSSWRDGTVCLWSVKDGKNLARLRTPEVSSVAFFPDGKRIVLGGSASDKKVRVWDLETKKEVATLSGHEGMVASVAVAPAGDRILSGSHDGTVRYWDVKTGQKLAMHDKHTREVTHVAFSRGGRQAISTGWNGTVCLWQLPR